MRSPQTQAQVIVTVMMGPRTTFGGIHRHTSEGGERRFEAEEVTLHLEGTYHRQEGSHRRHHNETNSHLQGVPGLHQQGVHNLHLQDVHDLRL